jgi:hypothetical protein
MQWDPASSASLGKMSFHPNMLQTGPDGAYAIISQKDGGVFTRSDITSSIARLRKLEKSWNWGISERANAIERFKATSRIESKIQ